MYPLFCKSPLFCTIISFWSINFLTFGCLRVSKVQYHSKWSFRNKKISTNTLRRCSSSGWFDAIITDPPYGVREKSEKVGTSKKFIDWIDYDSHYPDKVAYTLDDVFSDLMNFSYRHLKLNGMLVFWYPVSRPELQGIFF